MGWKSLSQLNRRPLSKIIKVKKYRAFKGNFYIKMLTLIIYLFCGIQTQTYAQEKITDNLNGMVNFHSGYNLPEYPFIASITEDYVRSMEVCFFKETVGKTKWEQLYNYPSYGVSLFYSSLGNDEVFGRELALTYFFKLYFFSRNRFRMYNRMGFGVGYVTRKFDLENNYLNVAVGSNFNIHFNFRVGANYALSDKFSVNAGLSFDHFSNANTSEPNLGVNYVTGYGGIIYGLGKKSTKLTHEIEDHVKENTFAFFASVGGKHSRALTSDVYVTSSSSFEFSRAVTRKFSLGIGGDLFYNSSIESSMENNDQAYKNADSFQTGIHLSQSLVYNRLTLSIQEGIYLFLIEKAENHLIYNRFLVQYQVSNHFLIRIAMKSHLHILDFPEIGFGYKF